MVEIDDTLNQLADILRAAGIEPNVIRYSPNELDERLMRLLGGEAAPDLGSWIVFAETWRHRMIAPWFMGVSDIEMATRDWHEGEVGKIQDTVMPLLAPGAHGDPDRRWDALPIGREPSGSLYVVSPATRRGSLVAEPRVCCWEWEAFFFLGDRTPGDPSVKTRIELPTLRDFLSELVRAHHDGRIEFDSRRGFRMAGAGGNGYGEYPWPRTVT